ncbi:MAG: hypothetical protein RL038_818 [Actinomycetota bacterium]
MHFQNSPTIVWLERVAGGNATAVVAELRRQLQANERVIVAAKAEQVDWLPQIALGLKHRLVKIEHYVIEGAMPSTFNTVWPDAPVTYFGSDPAHLDLARLRGWGFENSTTTTLEEVIAEICSGI